MADKLGPTDAIPSARVALFILPKGGSAPIPLALCEDFAATKAIASENFRTIGTPVVPANVSNIEEGRIRWGKVHTQDPATLATITPLIATWTAHQPFNVLALDPDTGDPVAMAVGVRPESLDLQARGGAAIRQNYTGLCRYVLLGPEVKSGRAAA